MPAGQRKFDVDRFGCILERDIPLAHQEGQDRDANSDSGRARSAFILPSLPAHRLDRCQRATATGAKAGGRSCGDVGVSVHILSPAVTISLLGYCKARHMRARLVSGCVYSSFVEPHLALVMSLREVFNDFVACVCRGDVRCVM